jgi:hypothetical protein
VLLVVLHEEAGDLLRALFHPLDVKVDLGPNEVLRGLVFKRGIGIGVVGGTAVAAGDDDPFAGLFLEVVEEVDEDGVDGLFPFENGEAVSGVAVEERGGQVGTGRVEGAPPAPEKVLGDPGEVDVRFPRIGGPGSVFGNSDRIGDLLVSPDDILGFDILPSEFLFFRTL